MTEIDAGKDLLGVLLGPGGVLFCFVVLIVALQRKVLVLGWTYNDCVADGTLCRTELSARISATEAEVQAYRKERGGRGD